jgi:xylan 1,4-beta-xylosidase
MRFTTSPCFPLLALLLAAGARAAAPAEAAGSREIFFADPTIHVADGRYYLTGTRHGPPAGFALLVSDDLREWRAPGAADPHLILRAGDGTFGTDRFWAPQILRTDAGYLLTYTASEQVALARAPSLLGPFRQEVVRPIDDTERNIDSFLFRDDDGRTYLYHVRFARGNYLWVAEFDLAAGRIKPGTLTRCFGRTEDWEATPAYRSAPIMEGPTVLKLRGRYYLFYSANHYRSVDYAVGYAVADSPTGPWVKHRHNPILHRGLAGENGPGHGDVFRTRDGTLHYVYHVHHSDTEVTPRRTRIVPLVLTWHEASGSYDITLDASRIIRPVARSVP